MEWSIFIKISLYISKTLSKTVQISLNFQHFKNHILIVFFQPLITPFFHVNSILNLKTIR